MTKVKDAVLNLITNEDGSVELPRTALKIDPKYVTDLVYVKSAGKKSHGGDLTKRIRDMWAKKLKGSYTPEITEYYIDKKHLYTVNRDRRLISPASDEKLGEVDLGDLAVFRTIAKVTIPGIIEGYRPAIALNLNERGEELGWGNNVELCSNMTIMKSEHLRSSYNKIKGSGGGQTKMSTDMILKQVSSYMEGTEEYLDQELKQIEEWKGQIISRDEFYRFVGIQFSRIQRINAYRLKRRLAELEDKTIPVTGVQLSRIAVEALEPSYNEYVWDNDHTSLWNLINYGTEVLKFQNGSDSATVLKANSNWVELIKSFPFSLS